MQASYLWAPGKNASLYFVTICKRVSGQCCLGPSVSQCVVKLLLQCLFTVSPPPPIPSQDADSNQVGKPSTQGRQHTEPPLPPQHLGAFSSR